MSERLLLGIDGGGTKVIAWLATLDESGRVTPIGRAIAGPANPQAVGWPEALGNLASAICGAFQDSGRKSQTVEGLCMAMAGAGRPPDQQRFESWVRQQQLAERIRVVHDAMAVLAAGTPQQIGVALIAGTGSVAFGRNRSGDTERAGGWGPLLGDEGSGYAIALAGLRRAVCAADGRLPPTMLLERYLAALQLTSPEDLVPTIYGPQMNRARLASFAHLVFDAARDGDAPAQELVTSAAGHLAAMAEAVARKLKLDGEPVPLACAGGMLVNFPELCRGVLEQLRARGLTPEPVQRVTDPVEGALALARDLLKQPQEY